jgi:hypothetical protein
MSGLVPRFPTAILATGTMILSFLSLVCGSRTRHGDARSVGGKAHALSWIPGPAEGGLKPWEEFFRFGLVGVVGFAVDASTLAVMLAASAGVFWGRAVSYVAAASGTWVLNRSWTFHDRSSGRAHQWAQFLAVNSCGGRRELWRLRPSRSSFGRLICDFSYFRRRSRFDLRPHHQLLPFEAHSLQEGMKQDHSKPPT